MSWNSFMSFAKTAMGSVGNRRRVRGPFLVTGATGFIGANLTRALVGLGEQVHVMLRPESSKWRIADISEHLLEHYCYLNDEHGLQEIMRLVKPRVVFHCAAYGVSSSQTDVNEIYNTNVLGTVKILQAASTIEFDAFINTGSVFEYGNKLTLASADSTPEPFTAYGAAKLAATIYCQMMARSEGYPVITLRLFTPYGPFESENRLIPTVVRACLERRELALTAGNQMRDFVFVSDVVSAYLKAAEITSLAGQVFNIGSGTSHTVKETVEQIISLLGAPTVPLWGKLPTRQFEIMRCDADITSARLLLEWVPQVSFSDGLSETVAWHRSRMITK